MMESLVLLTTVVCGLSHVATVQIHVNLFTMGTAHFLLNGGFLSWEGRPALFSFTRWPDQLIIVNKLLVDADAYSSHLGKFIVLSELCFIQIIMLNLLGTKFPVGIFYTFACITWCVNFRTTSYFHRINFIMSQISMPNFIFAALSETVPAQLELVYYVITVGAHIVIVLFFDYDNEHQI